MVYPVLCLQEKGQPQVVPAMRHGFSVTIQTAYRLPGSVAYAEAELHGPDSRYIKYMFPGGHSVTSLFPKL